jgi:SAM-dependent methyltransferase
MISELEQVVNVWNSKIGRGYSDMLWFNHPTVIAHNRRRITGDPMVSELEYFKRRYIPKPLYRGFSLGCGTGWLERKAIDLALCKYVIGIDASPKRIESAKALGESYGNRLQYFVWDVNKLSQEYGNASCGVVFAKAILHHIENLEGVLDRIPGILKPDGLLYIDDFIGPTRRQWPDEQLRIANDILAMLPPHLKTHIRTGEIKRPLVREDPARVAAKDPSETVRSGEVEKCVRERFTVVESHYYGGTLAHLLFGAILPNFNPANGEHNAILNLVLYLEAHLIDAGELRPDFWWAVCKRREG